MQNQCGSVATGLNSFQLLQTITGNGKRKEEENEGSSAEELEAVKHKISTSTSKKHLAMLKTDLADKNQWSSSSSDSLSVNEDIKKHLPNGSHADFKGDSSTTPLKLL